MQIITSRDNPKLKSARKVRDRREADLIFVEGIRLAEEAIRSNLNITEAFFNENFADGARGRDFLANIEKSGAHLYQLPDKIFDTIAATKNTQGVALLAEIPRSGREIIEDSPKNHSALFVMLHRVNNPSNLGAILRTAEAVGAAGVIVTKNSADAFSPKALRGAMGASFRLPLWLDADFGEALRWAKDKKIVSISADVNAEKSYLEIDWTRSHLVVFGSEAHGLAVNERAQIDESLIIPMENEVESLNLAVACGVILFEAKRQRAD